MPPNICWSTNFKITSKSPKKSGFLRIKLTYSIYNAKLNVQSIFASINNFEERL